MLSYSEFKDHLSNHLKEYLPVFEALDIKVEKYIIPNAGEMESLIVAPKDSRVAPAFRLNELYQEYQAGSALENIMEDIGTAFRENAEPPIEVDTINNIDEWDEWKDSITARIVNREKNRTLMEQAPWREVEGTDLIMVYDIFLTQESRTIVGNKLADIWGKSEEELHDSAMSFLEKEKIVCHPVNLPFMEEEKAQEDMLYYLSNEGGYFGASTMLQPGLLEHLESMFKREFVILPTSVHEVFLAPKDEKDPLFLQCMVLKENMLTDERDYLSDNVYSAKNGKLETITDENTLLFAKQILEFEEEYGEGIEQ